MTTGNTGHTPAARCDTRAERRVYCRLLRGITALSFVLSVALAVLWIRSYHHGDTLSFAWDRLLGSSGIGACSWRGKICFAQVIDGTGANAARPELILEDTAPYVPGMVTYAEQLLPHTRVFFVGARLVSPLETPKSAWIRFVAVLPHWALICLTSMPMLIWLRVASRRRVRSRRTKAGLCDRCGYDLRGSKDSGKCPECGGMAPAASGAGTNTASEVSLPVDQDQRAR
jgi:hypothetical protein